MINGRSRPSRKRLDPDELHAVREALNQELVLGRDDFKDTIEAMLKRQSRPGIPGRPRGVEDRRGKGGGNHGKIPTL